ncbi:hypothetical protein A2533_00190 [Candidatus Falkowbacteria bacterium RIFOXYD2_FULL_35_9]|uniref:Uncharacterized protein n=1 Tax=Candidatus Falkowbacteria bacterium RIFOXYC2_FULL_36_12 TaxID=1798002 RepID=A0A1F5T3W4_9BACT|nr:MAG: hypothetical protein A2300_01810 [Candidatus Falkowbacteria bacterium RIFOXYB2_FULL_35_7]OGF33423.1 MAG: hypothetical protein A2478_01860 [Candidatus Falkowbacteria bacterium RIFOXYC2_FULL_36_12]OGF33892.1 MAG: hypothetical protein A2223_02440 [Candidatus Falkowbacteria bacterium RIFOXYA2_FULL_35_8]OGF45787.1 MAG: hypothetical protein A2533_00190 [Candidatus Falkowbacteria bacterium RIFOXYD2_FULL_35_9]
MLQNVSIPTIVGAGLLDSINPCAIAVLIFLLTYLIALKIRRKVFTIGLVYILTVYIVYFLAGLGLLSAIASTKITVTIYNFASIVLLIFGIINIKDYFWPSESGPLLRIPESKKKIIEKWTKKASIPATIVLGSLVAAFELPCTGGIYLAILAMLGKLGWSFQPIAYLLIYNFFFVLPLLVIWLVMYYGQSSEKIKSYFQGQKNLLRLVMGLGMVLLALLMLFGLV